MNVLDELEEIAQDLEDAGHTTDSQRVRDVQESPQDMVEEWRATAHQAGLHQRDTFNARCETWSGAADELQEIIESHE